MSTTDDPEYRKKLLADTRADLLRRQLSNAENYDKAVLTLSTAALGFSVGFLKDFVPIAAAKWPNTLYLSWYALAGALIATILSYFASQRAITLQIKRAEDYYDRGSDDALPRTISAVATDYLNYLSGGLFIAGIVLTTAFVSQNIEGASTMSTKQTTTFGPDIKSGAPIPTLQHLTKGAPIPPLQTVTTLAPAQAPAMPAAPAAPAPQSAESGGEQK